MSMVQRSPDWKSIWGFTNRRGFSLIAAVLLSFSHARTQAADWPQILGPSRNGVAAETNLLTKWPADGPRIVWQKKVGQGFAGVSVADGKLIFFHRLNDKETVECLQAKNGSVNWKFEYPTSYRDDFGFDEGPRATPTIDGDKVFTFGAEGSLRCFNFSSGKQLWSVDCKQEFHSPKGFFGMACSPLVEGNLVILNVGGTDGTGIVAFNKLDGKLAWKSTAYGASYSSPVAATINGQREAIVFTRQGFVGLNPVDGKLFFDFPWRSRIDASVNAATPLVIGDKIFISACYETGAAWLQVEKDGVKKLWSSDDVLSNHYATSVYRNGFLYGFHGRTDPGMPPCKFRCVEAQTGKVRWSEEGLGPGTVIAIGSKLLILSERGELIMAEASPTKYALLSRAQILSSGVRSAPAFSDGFLFARSKDKLVCVDLRGE